MSKRPGRPRLAAGDTSTPILLTVPTKQYDELARQAIRRDISIAEVVRRRLRKNMKTRQ
jgi:hypothetical protein